MNCSHMNIPDIIRKATVALLIFTGPLVSKGQQDPLYTQYIFNLQTINPSYAGSWQTMGFQALSRHQWVGFTGHPTTQTFSFQTPLITKDVGVGLNVLHDQLGAERRLMFNLDYSYRIMLNQSLSLRFGLKGGFTNYYTDISILKPLPDGVPDQVLNTIVESRFLPNIGPGLFLSSPKYYLSLSVPRLLQNRLTLNTGNTSGESKEIRHLYFAGGIVYNLSDNLRFKPTFMTVATAGGPVRYDISANFLLAEKFWIGGMYRSDDAVGIITQWIINNKFRIGYASDFTITSMKYYHQGVHEVMMSYEIEFVKRRYASPRYF